LSAFHFIVTGHHIAIAI